MTDPTHLTPEQIVAYIAIASAVIGVLAWVRKRTKPTLDQWKQIGKDWVGEPDRPGVKGRPGVMVQMESMTTKLAKLSTELESVREIATEARYHSMPNGGNSAYDKLSQKIDETREESRSGMAEVREDTGTLIRTLSEHTSNLETLNERMTASENDRRDIHREISIVKFGGTERQQS